MHLLQGLTIFLAYAYVILCFWSLSLHEATIQQSSSHLCNLVLTSIFIETEISIQEGALCCETLSDSSPFIWDQVQSHPVTEQ